MAFRAALDPPNTELFIVSRAAMDEAVAYSRQSPRRRVIKPFHRDESEALHRMFNAVQPDSYIRPHRHLDPPKSEAWIVLRGAVLFFTFEDDGRIRETVKLAANGDAFGVDLTPGVYHTFLALEPDTVIFEIKNGPYVAATDKAFAPWSPVEGSPEASEFMQRLRDAFEKR